MTRKLFSQNPWKTEKEWLEYGAERNYFANVDDDDFLFDLERRDIKFYYYGVKRGWIKVEDINNTITYQKKLKKRKPRGYWNNFKNFKRELRQVVKTLGHFPTKNELQKLKLSYLNLKIQEYGGYPKVRKEMGYSSETIEGGYWNKPTNILHEARLFIKEHRIKQLPGRRILEALGYDSLANAIKNYPGKSSGLRKDLGESQITISDMTKKEWIEYGKKMGYHKLTRTQVNKRASHYYKFGNKKGWMSYLIPEKLPYHWNSRNEWLKFGRKRGFHKLKRGEISRKCTAFYIKGLEEKWLDDFVPLPIKKWKKEEWLQHGKEMGYDRITRSKLQHTNGSFYAYGWRHGWIDELIPSQIKTQKEVENYISQDPAAQSIVQVASLNQSYADVAQIFTELWPQRFASAEALAKQLPQVISKITSAIAPFVTYQMGFKGIYEALPAQGVPRSLEDLLYRIGIDAYQTEFNRAPKETVNKLYGLTKTIGNKKGQAMMRRIYSWYKEAYKFEIPGVGSLS
jgi:hypothetical protein